MYCLSKFAFKTIEYLGEILYTMNPKNVWGPRGQVVLKIVYRCPRNPKIKNGRIFFLIKSLPPEWFGVKCILFSTNKNTPHTPKKEIKQKNPQAENPETSDSSTCMQRVSSPPNSISMASHKAVYRFTRGPKTCSRESGSSMSSRCPSVASALASYNDKRYEVGIWLYHWVSFPLIRFRKLFAFHR